MTYPLAVNIDEVIDEFHKHWIQKPNEKPYTTWDGVFWRGYKCVKSPNDMLLYAMLIHELKPKCIIETGTGHGGSALFFAEMGHCPVISIDSTPYRPEWPQNTLINYMHSRSSTDPEILPEIAKYLITRGIPYGPILLSLDSDHSGSHVAYELLQLGQLARYIVVEDVDDGGPSQAVDYFLKSDLCDFVEDEEKRTRFLFSGNRWLRRAS